MPLINVTVDETHRVLDPNDEGMAELMDEMAHMGRKCGLSLTLATQLPTLGDLQRQGLKGMLAGGNVMVLRTGESLTGNIIATQPLPQNPYSLPREIELEDGRKVGTGGLGFFLGGAGRPAICRVMDLGDESEWAITGETTAAGADDERVLEAYAGDAYRTRRDRKRAAAKLEDPPGEKKAAGAAVRSLHSVPSQTAKTPNPRQAAIRVLRGTGQSCPRGKWSPMSASSPVQR
jgi:hypothetical protein